MICFGAGRAAKRTSFLNQGESAMRYPIKAALLCTALACALGSSGQAAQTPATPAASATPPVSATPPASNTFTVKPGANFVPVTDAMMRATKPEDLRMDRGHY